MKGRVAFLKPAPPGHGGGAVRTMARLAGKLAERGHGVDFITTRQSSATQDLAASGVRLYTLAGGRWAMLPSLWRYIKTEQPRAIVVSGGWSKVVILGWKKLGLLPLGLRVVVHQANPISRQAVAATGAPLSHRLAMYGLRQLVRRADAIIALNRSMAYDVRAVAPNSDIQVIPNPIDAERIVSLGGQPPSETHPADGQVPMIAAVARLTHQKDIPTLLRAFAIVLKERTAGLVVMGEGPELDSLKQLASQLRIANYVVFTGFVPNPYIHMATADLFVLSSRYEGLPNVLLEAALLGTPCVSTDCFHGPREILEGGRLGRLVPVGDAAALGAAMLAELDSPTSTRAERQASIRSRYDMEWVIDRYEEVLGLTAWWFPGRPPVPGPLE